MKLKELHDKYTPNVTAGSVARYAILPGVIPRLNRLASTIQHLLFSFVQIFAMAGLIDKQHPCLRAENIGRYKFSYILLLAWQNVRFDRKHMPQALMFVAVCMTLLVVSTAFILYFVQLLFHFGTAQAQSFYFQTPVPADFGSTVDYKPSKDWMFIFLQRIFGDNGTMTFWTGVPSTAANPWFTELMKGLLRAYSDAMLVLAAFMILYVLVMALADAAKTGQPFGESFDPIWAPIRMVIALFLLAPIPVPNSPYSTAQLLVFQTAEWGTNLANNLWLRTIHAMTEDDKTQTGDGKKDNAKFIAVPNVDPGYRFVRDVFLIHLCMKGYNLLECDSGSGAETVGVVVGTDENFISYRVGVGTGPAANYCGEIRIPIQMDPPRGAPGYDTPPNNPAKTNPELFWPNRVIKGYSDAVANLMSPDSQMAIIANKMVVAYNDDKDADFDAFADGYVVKKWIDDYRKVAFGVGSDDVDFSLYKSEEAKYNQWIVKALESDAQYGWGTAGAFFLRMTNAMSMASKVVEHNPVVNQLPVNTTLMFATPADPTLGNVDGSNMCKVKDHLTDSGFCKKKATQRILYGLLDKGNEWFKETVVNTPAVYSQLGTEKFRAELRIAQKEPAENTRDDSVFSSVSGAIYNMAKIGANDLNPLGTVVNWGMTFMALSVKLYTLAITAGFFVGAIKALTFGILNLGSSVSTLAFTVGNLFLIPGFILAFVVPFIPAFYFMFAVLEWIISVVEAVIAMPLWALSFITSEGGLFGDGMKGIKSLFEIALRPVLIIGALIFSVTIFTAGISFINDCYALFLGAYDDASGNKMGGVTSVVAGLGAGLIYVFLVYTYATSCFKIIDALPDVAASRWLGLPAGFHTMIRAGHHNFKRMLVEGYIFKQMLGKFRGIIKR